jgi:hypothetical protein
MLVSRYLIYTQYMKIPKLNRKQIREALDQMPIERVLLGSSTSKDKTLTNSQIKFAEEMAMGKTKAEAYRRSRPNGRQSKAKPATASRRGNELARDSRIQAQIDAFALAMEAQKYTTPLHLRALVIQKLTEKAINPDVKDSQQLKALELIGKLTEVQSFTERREVVNINADSSEMREKLMQSLRLALSNQDVTDVDEAELLLAEITGESDSDADADALLYELSDDVVIDGGVSVVKEGDGLGEIASSETHYTPDPNICHDSGSANLHSIPDTRSPQNLTPTNVGVTIPSESNTCVSTSENPNIGNPPLSVSNGNG